MTDKTYIQISSSRTLCKGYRDTLCKGYEGTPYKGYEGTLCKGYEDTPCKGSSTPSRRPCRALSGG